MASLEHAHVRGLEQLVIPWMAYLRTHIEFGVAELRQRGVEHRNEFVAVAVLAVDEEECRLAFHTATFDRLGMSPGVCSLFCGFYDDGLHSNRMA